MQVREKIHCTHTSNNNSCPHDSELTVHNDHNDKNHELSAAGKIMSVLHFSARLLCPLLMLCEDLSFPTIAGEGQNGAIIHYSADPDSCNAIGQSSMLLLDSGAQYEDGTTDVTRTMHFGEPTLEQKEVLCVAIVP